MFFIKNKLLKIKYYIELKMYLGGLDNILIFVSSKGDNESNG